MNTQEYKTGSSSSPKKNNNNNNNQNNNRNNVSQSPTLSPPVSPASISSSVGIVEVMLVEGRNLVSKNKSADVYVRMKIGDGFFHWSKSNTAKTTRPTWNYFIVLKVRPKQSRILHLRVNEVNFFAPDETLGECRLNLDELPPNETREMCVGLFPSSSSNGTKKGELFFKVSYYPNGKPLPARDSKAALPMQLLSIEQFKYPSSNPPAHEATNKKSESHAPSKPLEQIQAEQLYNKAMEEMSKFVEYARLAKKPADGSSAMSDIENSMVPAALKTASQLLFESLKLHRSGKSFAMLAFIFFQFDSLELTSKYLGYAEQLEPTFPVISRLRKLLVDSGCEREALDAKTPTDRLSVVVVGAKGLPLTTSGTVCCRLIVGYPEISKDTGYAPLSTQDPNAQGTVNWETFFDVALSKATERYHFGHQNLVVQLFEKTEETGTIIGECSPIDLFSVERDCVHDHWLPLTNGKGSVRVVFNYQMGFLTPEEYPPLLYSALLSRDHPMVSSLMKRNPNLDQIFRDTNSHTTPSEIEPKNSTLLTKAARFGNIRMLKELIEFGASINGVDLDGFTPIMRAVQFDGVHDNKRAIRYLYDLGADLSIKNSKSFDIFAYCQSVEMRQFLKERTQMSMYKVAVVICPSCRYVQFPRCTEFKAPCVQSIGCSCEILACPNCSFQLSEEHRQVWLASLREIQYSAQAFTPNLPEVIDHYLFQCRKCMSFGFPGTFTPTGSELTTATDTAVVGTADNSFDKTEYSLKDAETMWTLLYHEACCSMHSSAYQLVRVKLSRTEVNSLVSLAANSTSFWDAPQPSVTEKPSQTFTLDQLPYEILQQIVGYLLCEDIAVCENVSHKLRESCDEGFWKSLAKRDFAVKKRRSASSEEEPETWKENYLFYTKLFSWVKELFFEENFLPRRTNFITDNGQVEVHLRLNGKKYLFNLDGMPFTFEEEFVLVASFSAPGEVTSLKLIAQGQSAANSIQLCGVLTVPPQSKTTSAALLANLQEHQQQNGKVTLTLAMEQSAIKKWVGPYLNLHIPGFYAFLMLKDNVGGSVILDIFYYTLQDYVLEK